MRSSGTKYGKAHSPDQYPAGAKCALDVANQTILRLSTDSQKE